MFVLEKIEEEMAIAHFKMQSQYSTGGTEEHYMKLILIEI